MARAKRHQAKKGDRKASRLRAFVQFAQAAEALGRALASVAKGVEGLAQAVYRLWSFLWLTLWPLFEYIKDHIENG
jgi:hypothetical protein